MQRVAEHVARLEEGLRIAAVGRRRYRAARVARRAAPPDPSPRPARIPVPPAVRRRGARRWHRRPRESAPAPIRRCAARRRSRTAAPARGSRVDIRLPPATAGRAPPESARAASRSGSRAARQASGVPPRAIDSLAVPSASKPSRRWLAEPSAAVRGQRRKRTAAAPFQLRTSLLSSVRRRRAGRLQPNYHAEQPVARADVGQLGVARTGVHADPQVDVAFADFEKIDAGVELAGHRVRPAAGDDDVGGEFDQRIGFVACRAGTKPRHPNGAEKEQPRGSLDSVQLFLSRSAGVAMRRPMFTGTCAAPQRKIENGGRVCSKSLIEKYFVVMTGPSERNPEVMTLHRQGRLCCATTTGTG